MTIVAIHGSENGSENLQFSLMMTSCARTNSPDLAISLNSLDASFAHDRVIYTYSKAPNVSRCASELTFSSARGLIYSTPLDENENVHEFATRSAINYSSSVVAIPPKICIRSDEAPEVCLQGNGRESRRQWRIDRRWSQPWLQPLTFEGVDT
jgi:hypothetical protein